MTQPVAPATRRWEPAGDDRWVLDGDPLRHLLLHAGAYYVELHGGTVHVYRGPEDVADPTSPLAFTLADGNAWVLTGSVNVATEAEAWAAMADPRFTDPAPDEPELPPAPEPPGSPAEPPPAPAPVGDDEEEES